MYNFDKVVAVCITEDLTHLGSLVASINSLFLHTENLTYLLILNHEEDKDFAVHSRLVKDALGFIPNNNKLLLVRGHGGSVAREKMLQLDTIKKFDWYLNSDDDVLYNRHCVRCIHHAITVNPCNSDRYGFGFWDILQREGTKNWFSSVFNIDDIKSLIDMYEPKDAPFHYWHNFQRWNTKEDEFVTAIYDDKPTAFANSYFCKPSVFEPFVDTFLNWEKGVRGYDVHLHTVGQKVSWPFIFAHVTHIGCFNGLMNDSWKSHKPVSKEDKRENLQNL